MGSIVLIGIIAILIGLIEVPSLLKKGLKKELMLFFILLLCGVAISVSVATDIPIPSPIEWITMIFSCPLTIL